MKKLDRKQIAARVARDIPEGAYVNLGIGLLTPPVGPTMVIGCAIGRVSMEAVSRSILVFYIPMLIVLALVTSIPELSLWLPRLVLR